jgi:putative flavoprotein involved in K+ transport
MSSVTNPQILFERWLAAFEAALRDEDAAALDHLLLETSYWRDQIALSWDMQQFWGRDAFRDALLAGARDMRPHQFTLDPSRAAPTVVPFGDTDYIEGFFTFALPHGIGQGFLKCSLSAAVIPG